MKSPRITLITVSLSALVALRRNPQYLNEKQNEALRKSIERDGFLAPIVIRKHGHRKHDNLYEVLSGNHRVLASREAGLSEIPACLIDPCDNQRAARIAINLNTVHGDPTVELLAPFLADLDDATLKSVFLQDDLLRDVVQFDATLEERLKCLLLPTNLNRDSPLGSLPSCVCRCGHRHVPARNRSGSPKSGRKTTGA